METEVPKDDQDNATIDDSDWDNRVLCSDGNCIGVIGRDGHCKECGKKYEGDRSEVSHVANEAEAAPKDFELSSEATEIPENIEAPVDDSWENRVLCSDGNCIGVIGVDGKCKECGKPMK